MQDLGPNLFISEDGRHTAILVKMVAFSVKGSDEDILAGFADSEPGADGKAAAKNVSLSPAEIHEVLEAIRQVNSRFEGAGFEIHLTGQPVVNTYFNKTIGENVGLFMSLSYVAFSILLFILFRRFSGVVLPLMVVTVCLVATVGLMAATGAPFSSVTTILPSFLLAVGVGSSVHLLVVFYRRFGEFRDKEEAMVHAMGHSGLPIAMTSITTAAGLVSFATASIVPVANLEIFGGLGVLIILLVTLILLPAVIALLPLSWRPGSPGKARATECTAS